MFKKFSFSSKVEPEPDLQTQTGQKVPAPQHCSWSALPNIDSIFANHWWIFSLPLLLADFPERQQQLLLGDGRLTVALISSWLELERRLKAALLVGGGTTISCAVQLARWSAAVSKVKTITNSQNSQSVFVWGGFGPKIPNPAIISGLRASGTIMLLLPVKLE